MRIEDRLSRSAADRTIRRMTPLAAAVMAALYPVAPVAAQGQDPNNDELEEVVVTGSRISRDGFSSAVPMDVLTPDGASVDGTGGLGSLLQSSTAAAGSPQVTPAISAASTVAGGLGTSTISLRGLGANRTLVLLNGRRAGPAGVQGAVSAFDLNVIPLVAVERVEILKDGASSIYGSDAVAGVVNIITRKDDGADFDVYFSQPHESGGEHLRLSGSFGKQFDRGYFRATAAYNRQEILQRGDRDYFKCDEHYVFDTDTGERADMIDPRTNEPYCEGTTWGHVWVYDYAAEVGPGTTNVEPPIFLLQYDYTGALAGNNLPQIQQPGPGGNPNWMSHPEGWYPVERGDRLSNSLTDSDHPLHDTTTLVPEAEVSTFLLEGAFDLSDSLTAYSEVLLSRRKTADVGFTQIWSYIYTADSADLGWPGDPQSAGWTGAQWLSPLAITDHNDTTVTVDYQRFVAGLRGKLGDRWDWETSIQYSKSDGEYLDDIIYNDSIRTSYWRTDATCAGTVTSVSNLPCVDLRWLDPDFHFGNFTQEERDFLFGVDKGTTEYTLFSTEAFLSGDLFEMPAGTAAAALGVQFQRDEILDTPGPTARAGNNWLVGARGITAGEVETSAVFGEVRLPLLADAPFADALELAGSARYTDVDLFGGETTFKVGLSWSINPEVHVRSSFGTSFRTPSLFELFLAPSDSGGLPSRSDPCQLWGDKLARGEITQNMADNCASIGIPPDKFVSLGADVVTGGGAGVLEAETSEMLTAGIVWQPSFANLSMSIDYFDIDVRDQVDVFGALNLVEACYDSPFFPDEPLCSLIDRNPEDPTNAFESFRLTTVRDSFINVAQQRNRGVDVALRYAQELPGAWGTLMVDTQHTFLIEDVVALFDETREDLAGEAGRPEWVGKLNLSLQRNEWSFFWGMNFIGETSNREAFGRDTVVSSWGEEVAIDLKAEFTMYHNLSVSRDFANGVTARLGVRNALDETPPRMTSWQTGAEVNVLGQASFYSQYDWFGRRYFLNVSKEFDL
ncbi:MAG: TonB-dependent receptor [Woeseia sp.]